MKTGSAYGPSKDGELFICTGPVLKDGVDGYIGRKNKVGVAKRFFKVILDYREPDLKMIAFILPHKEGLEDISVYAMTVRDAERITGFDFFPTLPHNMQEKLETELDMGKWGLKPGVRKYASPTVETAGTTVTLEQKLVRAVQNPTPQPDKNSDRIILFIAIGLGVILIMGGIVIFIGFRMNRRK